MKRTDKQNAALHLFCTNLAKKFNASGMDMRTVLKPEVEIPWTKDSVKTHIWKPIQDLMFEKTSTTDLTTKEVSEVYEALNAHLGTKLKVHEPWPSAEEQLLTNQDD